MHGTDPFTRESGAASAVPGKMQGLQARFLAHQGKDKQTRHFPNFDRSD
jgi:hypothetical protein